jgi:hypothetical protein
MGLWRKVESDAVTRTEKLNLENEEIEKIID